MFWENDDKFLYKEDCQPGFVKRSKAYNKMNIKDFTKQGIEKLIRNAVMNVLGHTENHSISSFPCDIFKSGAMGRTIRKNMYDVIRFRTTFEKASEKQIGEDFDRIETLIQTLKELLKTSDKLWAVQVNELLLAFHLTFKCRAD